MRILLLGFIGILRLASAQSTVHLDLSGDWRKSTDDRPEYSQPGFDDHRWAKVQLPWTRQPDSGTYWLRRAIDLPTGFDQANLQANLVVTLGPVAQLYRLYFNGVRIAEAGAFEDLDAEQLARSRSFPVPPGALGTGPQLHVAIQCRRTAFPPTLALFLGESYVVTDAASVPANENLLLIAQQKVARSTTLVTGVVLLLFAILFWLLWLADRERLELLWLGVLVSSRGVSEVANYLLISLESYPVRSPQWYSLTHAINGAALAELVLASAAIKSGWLRGLFWVVWTGIYLLRLSIKATIIPDLAVLVILFACWWRSRRHQQGWPERLTWIALTLVALTHLNVGARQLPTSLDLGGYSWNVTSFSMAFFSVILALLTLRRLIADRNEKQRLAGELEAARTVQQLLLPAFDAKTNGYEVQAVYEPAQEVGGDFHWRRMNPDGSLMVVVGDVSGKGLKAAMLVSVAVGILRNEKSASPARILAALNDGLTGHSGGGFVTCCCARFDVDGTVTIASAGYPAPYCDGVEAKVESGLPLGVVKPVEYAESRMAGSCVTLVSDGVAEADNTKRELFGFDRTRGISTKPAQEIADAARAWGQNDDITVVTVRRTA